jgi:hypothetical protein
MSNQLSTIICVIFGVISWYYFNKFLESEREYSRLHSRFESLSTENQKMKSRIKDLQSYKNDVSKTFKILDNELVMINDHLKKHNQQEESFNNPVQVPSSQPVFPNIRSTVHTQSIPGGQATIRTSTIPLTRMPLSRVSSFTNIPGNSVSLLTPELLTSLFNMNTEDLQTTQSEMPQRSEIPQRSEMPQTNQSVQNQHQSVQDQHQGEVQDQGEVQNQIQDEVDIQQQSSDNQDFLYLENRTLGNPNYDQYLLNNN